MARTEFVRRTSNDANMNPVGHSPDCYGRPGCRVTAWWGLAALLGLSTMCAAASGPGLGFKVGAQTVEDPIDRGRTTRARFELELSSPRWYDDHFDLALMFGGSSLGSFTDDYMDIVDGAVIEESYTDRLFLFDVRLAGRFYPLGDATDIRPYLGGGLGYFWFEDYWEYEYYETFEDPFFPGTFHTIGVEEEGTDTVAQGFFPFVLAGVSLPLGSNGELLFEFQYDFEKKDSGFDLGGPIYLIGARLRF